MEWKLRDGCGVENRKSARPLRSRPNNQLGDFRGSIGYQLSRAPAGRSTVRRATLLSVS